jgi:hypothetical protein
MKLQNLEPHLSSLDALWKRGSHSDSWHGYGVRTTRSGKRILTLFLEPEATAEAASLKARISDDFSRISTRHKLTVETMHFPHFRSIPGKRKGSLPGVLQPGNTVFTSGSNCQAPCSGTIGAFLASANGAQRSRTWLLSNHHILAECTKNVTVKGITGANIGKKVSAVPLLPDGNLVDCAVVEVANGSPINPIYRKLGKLSKTPVALTPGARVRKLGASSGVTSATFLWSCPKVRVHDCMDTNFNVFLHQLMFVSVDPDQPFAVEGDSGSLVWHNGHPVGLLCAQTNATDAAPPDTAPKPKPPFFLANPWRTVLRELSKKVKTPLKIVLAPEQTKKGG